MNNTRRHITDRNLYRLKQNKFFINCIVSLIIIFYVAIFYYRINYDSKSSLVSNDPYKFPIKDIPDNIHIERLQRILIKNNVNRTFIIDGLTELTFKEYIKYVPPVKNVNNIKKTIRHRIELITKKHDKPYFYIHFAKTGGTSFINSVKTQYDKICHFWDGPNKYVFNECIRQKYGNVDFIMGHIYFGLYRAIPIENDKTFYFGIFRNPIYRVLSHYKYHKSQLKDANHLHAANRNLTEWVRDVEFANNHMTLYLSGMVESAWWNDELENKLFFRPKGNDKLTDFFEITEDFYKEALYNLNNYVSLVGLQEQPNETIDHFSYFLNSDFEQEHLNIAKDYKKELTKDEINIIKRKNEYDLLLYDYVVDYFVIQRSFINVLKNKIFKNID